MVRIPGFLPGGPGLPAWEPSSPPLSDVFPLLPSRFRAKQNLGVGGYGSLNKCAVEEAPPSPGFHSRFFVVLKASGVFHPVIDLSFLNKHIFTQVSAADTFGSDGGIGRSSSGGCALAFLWLPRCLPGSWRPSCQLYTGEAFAFSST